MSLANLDNLVLSERVADMLFSCSEALSSDLSGAGGSAQVFRGFWKGQEARISATC